MQHHSAGATEVGAIAVVADEVGACEGAVEVGVMADGSNGPPTPDPPPLEQVAEDLAALAAIDGELGALDVALRRLDDGSYWTCEACGQGIEEAVLAEAPLRRRCFDCDEGAIR